MDLLGLKRIDGNRLPFAVIELKNKNNPEIATVFSQAKRYLDDLIKEEVYEDFRVTYECVLKQKKGLGLFKGVDCLERAIKDWEEVKRSCGCKISLFLKTNILDDTFFMDLDEAKHLLEKFKQCNC